MTHDEPERAPAPALTPLPRLEDLPKTPDGGLVSEAVEEAFDAFRRHALQLQAQLRVMKAAEGGIAGAPTGHAVRMDALHLIRAAAEFADVLERDAHLASAAQLERTERDIGRRNRDVGDRERELERYREDSENQRVEILHTARNEARDIVTKARGDAAVEMRQAEAKGDRLLEQARHNATELTNSARAEVDQTLEWARAQSNHIIRRAQQGAEQLLAAAGLGPAAVAEVAEAILASVRGVPEPRAAETAAAAAPPVAVPEPVATPEPTTAAPDLALQPEPPSVTQPGDEPGPPTGDDVA